MLRPPDPGVSPFLVKNSHFFEQGKGKIALDIAAKHGNNAIFLARLGFKVECIEENKEQLKTIAEKAEKSHVHLKLIAAPPSRIRLEFEKYDLILCFYFVNRNLVLQIKKALKPEGIVVMESERSILKPKELLFFFKEYDILEYRETSVASILARKKKGET